MEELKTEIKFSVDSKKVNRVKKVKKETQVQHQKPLSVSDIIHFFTTSDRSGNDASNKIRERILQVLSDSPIEFMTDVTYGHLWKTVHTKWEEVVCRIAVETNVGEYTHYNIKLYGGRTYHYDAILSYYQEQTCITTRKIEFKNGGTMINELPQFLSLPSRCGLFSHPYEIFYYERYLDQYLSCDSGITEQKPSLEVYQKNVGKTTYSCLPFFAQLKERELVHFQEKKEVVNRSIMDYLEQYGSSINVDMFYQKVVSTQHDKLFILWSQNKFHMDTIKVEPMIFHSIVNKNVIQLQSGSTMYRLLLRWKNHKGILNPAFQISKVFSQKL